MSRVKFAEEIFFYSSFLNFFGFWAKNFSDFWPKIFRNLSKLPSTCPEEQFVAWIFFKFWNVSAFLQKPLTWFSKFYLRVQSKICGRNIFFSLPSWIFSDFERKIFQTFGQKASGICQNYLLRVQRNNLWLEFFLSFETFRLFCRNLWHGSQNSIYVSRVKFAEEIFFLFFLPEFFRILSKNFSDFWPKNFKKFSKLPSTCPEEQFVAWNSSAWFSKFYLRVQSKNFGRNSFFCFLFRVLSNFEQKFFRLLAKKLQKVFKTTYVSRGKVCDLKVFFKVLNCFGFSKICEN